MAKKVNVKQDPENEVSFEVMAQSIADIGSAMRKFQASRLSRKALITLIADDTKLGKGTVDAVLSSLEQLEATYLKRATKK